MRMGASIGIGSLLAVAVVALLAPLAVGLLPWLRVPQVVLLIAGGVLIGPGVLHLSDPAGVGLLSDVGLGFVFLLAGYEVHPLLFGRPAGRRALLAWGISLGLAFGVVGVLAATGVVRAFVPVALALTTTALGTLLPILKERGLLHGRLGEDLLAAGAVGELFPVIAIALFLGTQDRFAALGSLAAVAVLAALLGLAARFVRPGGRLATVIRLGQHETSQITLRGTLLLLVALVALTSRFHLDAVLGAFLAGMVLRRWARGSAPALEAKLDALGHGFFVPVFFVSSGMGLDLHAIASAPLRVLLFTGLLLVVRGLPALLVYRRALGLRERFQTVLITATSLPLLVALAEIGLRNGTMLRANAAALVGAGVVSVLVFPQLALALGRRAPVPRPPLPRTPELPSRRPAGELPAPGRPEPR
jgi:Kef-type K+ transport system membrane component KefB